MAELISLDPENPNPTIICKAARILKTGGLVSFPTETVYGLGADATNPSAIARIYEAKGRPANNPLIVHCENLERVHQCVSQWPKIADLLAQTFWPGPLTLVLPKSRSIPMIATAGLGTVGVRIPKSRVALTLIAEADCPIAAPSANLSNRISPTTAQHVQQDLGSRIPMILDAGPCSAGVESTVIDLSGDVPAVLRPGPITTEMLSRVLGQQITVRTPKSAPDQNEMMNSPGQLTVHYAPRKPLRLWRNPFPDSLDWDDTQVASLLMGQDNPDFQKILSQPLKGRCIRISSARESEHRLYQILHELDLDPGVCEIHAYLSIDRSNLSEWAAVLDRLTRAAANFQ